ncbi:uncharacterized protein LOC142165724 [Nicotiana tabacum]|uniref:Uncharacterized protein LOC142165724 n=1 Tax=Nicotiana tabacum TaxID=4097 RepID=A0AC58S5G5_TOBAC
MIEEGALEKKARAKWIQLGDSNTKYFSTVMKERSQRKQILELHSITGNRITDSKGIKREIVEFYKSLMGAAAQSFPAIDKMVFHKCPKFNQQQRIKLCKDVTPEEIYEGLYSIGDDKAPGVDRYNACFFKKAWPIIKDKVTEVVLEFFTTGKLYRAINCTAITLVPKTVNYSIVVNGEPTKSFNTAKGLKQGDPMSPFLIFIAMEYLSRNLANLKMVNEFKYHPRCAKLGITHLSFTDDLLLFAGGDLKSVQAVQQKFYQFTQVCRLQANLNKSEAYFGGVPTEDRQQILQLLGLSTGELPFKYLCVSLSTKKLSVLQWQPLIDKITAKTLSYAGRVQLVQSILFGIQAF